MGVGSEEKKAEHAYGIGEIETAVGLPVEQRQVGLSRGCSISTGEVGRPAGEQNAQSADGVREVESCVLVAVPRECPRVRLPGREPEQVARAAFQDPLEVTPRAAVAGEEDRLDQARIPAEALQALDVTGAQVELDANALLGVSGQAADIVQAVDNQEVNVVLVAEGCVQWLEVSQDRNRSPARHE